jgi:hypothetical protein
LTTRTKVAEKRRRESKVVGRKDATQMGCNEGRKKEL